MNAAQFAALFNIAALVAIMLAMGLQVRFEAVTASVRPVYRVALAVLANYVFVPAVTVGLLGLFQPEEMVSVGFLILAVCPGAPIGPLAAKLAKGNVAWAIGMMVILAGMSAALSPLLLGLLIPVLSTATELRIDFLAIVRTLVLAQLLPLAVGLAVHHGAPRFTAMIEKAVGSVANLMLLVLIVLILVAQYETLADIRARGWIGMGLLFIASVIVGWLCGGGDRDIRKALAVTTSGRNAAVGLAIVTSNFAGTAAVTAVVAYALVSIIGTFACAALLGNVAAVKPPFADERSS
jgi:BASS family bile acid:Na+ symporter